MNNAHSSSSSDKVKLEHELFQALTMSSEEACLKPLSRDDLFDIVGMDFKNKLSGGSQSNHVNNRSYQRKALSSSLTYLQIQEAYIKLL
ncbi:hypothetical protein L1987_64229 [Smallanthus sonchifolius]|uniref:Uncharacterized protein n=1 Tax=Smallanthus sonchifolius TaxID=185202 RepID=A0ACB9CFF8_9ASTR|nr:hypothetical protein L1987_64229 [Smallanthus sonchifolius]